MRNVRPTGYGFQLYTRVRGQFISEHVTAEPSALDVRNWVMRQHVAIKENRPELSGRAQTLGQAIVLYLPLVQTMASFRWRKDDLELWLAVFGPHRTRQSITAAEIRAQLEAWRAEGYAASTVNHRRTALMHLWSVLDGKTAPNPARDVPRYPEDYDERPPRTLSDAAIDGALAAMPDGLIRSWLVLMRWTGWPQAQVRRLTLEQIRWNQAVRIGRRKGKGAKPRWVPLVPPAWTALRAFMKLRKDAVDLPETWRLRSAFRQAAARAAENRRLPKAVRAELADVTPYQLRHTFGTLVAATTKDERAAQELLIQGDIRQTRRYTEASVSPRTAAAVDLIASRLQVRRKSRKNRKKTA